ncbi:MAG: hypothetical protein FWE25_08355 [Lachnospiraceae bacterium]|nr:hypothetical protein [Lachnospiraceae bacterium]
MKKWYIIIEKEIKGKNALIETDGLNNYNIKYDNTFLEKNEKIYFAEDGFGIEYYLDSVVNEYLSHKNLENIFDQ